MLVLIMIIMIVGMIIISNTKYLSAKHDIKSIEIDETILKLPSSLLDVLIGLTSTKFVIYAVNSTIR